MGSPFRVTGRRPLPRAFRASVFIPARAIWLDGKRGNGHQLGTLRPATRGLVEPLKFVLAEHRRDNSGDVLPHLFERWAETLVTNGSANAMETLRRLMSWLEEAYQSHDPDIEELLSVSFLEHLPRPEEGAAAKIREMPGPEMSAQFRRIG